MEDNREEYQKLFERPSKWTDPVGYLLDPLRDMPRALRAQIDELDKKQQDLEDHGMSHSASQIRDRVIQIVRNERKRKSSGAPLATNKARKRK